MAVVGCSSTQCEHIVNFALQIMFNNIDRTGVK